jgi:hypothetical protein
VGEKRKLVDALDAFGGGHSIGLRVVLVEYRDESTESLTAHLRTGLEAQKYWNFASGMQGNRPDMQGSLTMCSEYLFKELLYSTRSSSAESTLAPVKCRRICSMISNVCLLGESWLRDCLMSLPS